MATTVLGVRLTAELMEWIDIERGGASRSDYIRRLVEEARDGGQVGAVVAPESAAHGPTGAAVATLKPGRTKVVAVDPANVRLVAVLAPGERFAFIDSPLLKQVFTAVREKPGTAREIAARLGLETATVTRAEAKLSAAGAIRYDAGRMVAV